MYEFIDTTEVSEGALLPSEALQINGDFIENLIPGYRTLHVRGREALSPELTSYETGTRDGAKLQNSRFPARIIVVTYQLIAESSEAFRMAYNTLGGLLNVQDAELIFNDEPDKFFTGTPYIIGEVEPGKNAVIGEIEFCCADPFKYSVVEYEAIPTKKYNGFLIEYNGTHKSYPTLEAEFFNEDEADADLNGKGDCGYVAFFNEREKIIQLGDPKEEDEEEYAKSQTLVNQKFNKETSWGTTAQTNWGTNIGKVSSDSYEQLGSVAITTASYLKTVAPSTIGPLLEKTSKAAKPYIEYKVEGKTSGRTADSVNVKLTIGAKLTGTSGSGTNTIKDGAKVTLKDTPIYVNATTTSSAGKKSGTFYIWDDSVVNKRVRITNTAKNVGKSGQVTAWVNVADISGSANSIAFGKGYGLKASIQFNGGDWHSVTLKSQSVSWNDNKGHAATLSVKVDGITADTTTLEKIKFKVERTDDKEGKAGVLEETACKDLDISTYTAPVPDTFYLMPEFYGTGSKWHGPSITRTIPNDAAGDAGAKNFTFSYSQKMAIGSSGTAPQELGAFQALLVSGSGNNRKIVAGVNIYKNKSGKKANLRFYVNGKTVHTMEIDLSYNNKYFGNNSASKKITTVKTSTITKIGNKVQFNIGGIKKTFKDNGIKDTLVKEITFFMGMYGTKPALSFNGLYWAKFVKNNCDTWEDIPNKFSSNDVVTADCKSGEVYLNNTPTPSLGALGNDWEEFYLTPGLNQIGFSYSDWVEDGFEPNFKVKYREVFL